jgi:Putative porin
MKRTGNVFTSGAAILAGAATIVSHSTLADTPPGMGASTAPSDAEVLLQIFEKKGLISAQDVSEARQALDARHASTQSAVAAGGDKLKLPGWVNSIVLTSDFRFRFEENNASDPAYIARDRYRFRLRLGAIFTLQDDFEIGVRLASGNPQTNPSGALVGGQPITANQDLGSLDSRKFVWLDAAYARWTPIHDGDWTAFGEVGKFDNPFRVSNMLFDYDIVPEGTAIGASRKLSDDHQLKATGAFFVLGEINQGAGTLPTSIVDPTADPYLLGAQLLWEAKWTPRFSSSAGISFFDLGARKSLTPQGQDPFYNSGNTRDSNGVLLYNYNPVIGSGSVTWKGPDTAIYPGNLPVTLNGEYLENPSAPVNNHAWRAGVTLGKAGKRNTWEVSYRYQRLEADAWFDALEDDDNGAYYATGNPQMAGTGKKNGWFGGTNVKGSLFQGVYSFTDYMNLTFTYYLNSLIVNIPGHSSDAGHFMADLNWRF